MVGFEKPHDVKDVDLAFGGNMKALLPPYESIPKEFKDSENVYARFQSHWFFSGLTKEQIPKAKPGIDLAKAMRHLSAIQGSFEPKHEHKMAGVAYLASLWLEVPNL